MKKFLIKASAFISMLILSTNVFSQEEMALEPIDSLQLKVNDIKEELSKMKKLKISGYIQSQFQIADSSGISSMEGGSFPAEVNKRFGIRRGRIKFEYKNNNTQYVMQFDVTEKGFGTKDVYIKIDDPFKQAFSLTTGIFNRPFGHEIEYSSSLRETPERSRFTQTLFPGERDLGAMISFKAPKTSPFNPLSIRAGMFSGTGPSAVDYDEYKDFIGNIRYDKAYQKMKLGLGASIYMGGSQNAYIGDKYFVYSDIKSYDNGAKGYQVDSTSRARKSDRNFNGIDFQFSYDAPWGIVDLRGEYIFGSQQGVSNSSSTFTSKPTTVTYVRNFQGYYIYFIQSIYNTKHKIVFKYDVYDPNVDVKNDEIGYRGETNKIASSLATNSTDIKYSTIAIAWLYQYNSNVRIMANYSIVKNETSKYLAGFNNDLKDNVFTLRVQYKF